MLPYGSTILKYVNLIPSCLQNLVNISLSKMQLITCYYSLKIFHRFLWCSLCFALFTRFLPLFSFASFTYSVLREPVGSVQPTVTTVQSVMYFRFCG